MVLSELLLIFSLSCALYPGAEWNSRVSLTDPHRCFPRAQLRAIIPAEIDHFCELVWNLLPSRARAPRKRESHGKKQRLPLDTRFAIDRERIRHVSSRAETLVGTLLGMTTSPSPPTFLLLFPSSISSGPLIQSLSFFYLDTGIARRSPAKVFNHSVSRLPPFRRCTREER